MIDAGLPITQALRTLAKQQKSSGFRAIIEDLYECVQRGESLTDAISKHPEAFDEMYVKLISASEKAGMLEDALKELVKYLERKRNLKRQVLRAMLYPGFVFFAAIFILFTLRFVLLPMFAGTSSGNNPVNRTVGQLLSLVDTILILSVVVPLVIVGVSGLLRQSQSGRYIVDFLKLKVPIVGVIFRKAALARFTRSLGMMLRAGVPIIDALALSRDVANNTVIARQIDFVKEQARQGSSLTEPLRKSRAIDVAVTDMIEIGEESGKLEESLIKVAEYYENEVEELIYAFLAMLKPALIVFICLLMGYMILVMWASVLSSVGGSLN